MSAATADRVDEITSQNTNSPANLVRRAVVGKKTRGGVASALPNRSAAIQGQSYLNGAFFLRLTHSRDHFAKEISKREHLTPHFRNGLTNREPMTAVCP